MFPRALKQSTYMFHSYGRGFGGGVPIYNKIFVNIETFRVLCIPS